MSDPMQGAPPRGGMPGNSSIFNPQDAAMMATRGDFTADMTVRQVMEKMGIDVDGPATQLVQVAQDQMQKRTMTGRLQSRPPQGGGMPGPRPMAPPPQPPGLESGGMEGLMRNLKG